MNTDYITLTELWNERKFAQVGEVINKEGWSPSQVAEFCAYFAKYVGLTELNLLYKFL
jgi:hypothetical protein